MTKHSCQFWKPELEAGAETVMVTSTVTVMFFEKHCTAARPPARRGQVQVESPWLATVRAPPGQGHWQPGSDSMIGSQQTIALRVGRV